MNQDPNTVATVRKISWYTHFFRRLKIALALHIETRKAWRQAKVLRDILADEAKNELSDKKERERIALAFNTRYVHGAKYFQEDEGEWDGPDDGYAQYHFRMPRGHAWMCPTCNRVHRALRFDGLQGLIYPKCCEHRQNHRTTGLPSKADLKRPIGKFGPDSTSMRRMKADFPLI